MEHEPLDGFDTPLASWPDSGYATKPGTQWTPEKVKSKRANIVELILQQVTLALRGNLANGHSFGQLRSWGSQVEEVLTLNTEAIVKLQDVAAAMNTTLSYVGDDDQMVSVPRHTLSIPTIGGSSTPPKSRNLLDPVEFVYSGVYHHGVLPVIRPGVEIGSTRGDIIYTPITSDRKGIVRGVAWVGGADTSIFSIDHYFLSLCVIDVATNKIVKAWDSGDLKNAEAAVNNARPAEIYKAIDTEQIATPGQILCVAHQQIAPGALQTARTIGAAPAANIEKASAVRQAGKGWCLIAPAHTQGIPSEISLDNLVLENRFIPWFGLRVSAIQEEV